MEVKCPKCGNVLERFTDTLLRCPGCEYYHAFQTEPRKIVPDPGEIAQQIDIINFNRSNLEEQVLKLIHDFEDANPGVSVGAIDRQKIYERSLGCRTETLASDTIAITLTITRHG